MTDNELYRTLGAWETNVILLFIFLVALLSAYLVAAHIAGRHLRRPQAVVITGLMLWFSFIILSQIHSALQVMIDMRELAFFGYTTLRKALVYKWLVTLGCAVAPIACVTYMIHVRRPRRGDAALHETMRRSTD